MTTKEGMNTNTQTAKKKMLNPDKISNMETNMTKENTILVTGATGTLGRSVVKALLDRDFQVIGGSRNPTTANFPSNVKTAQVIFEDIKTMEAALQDVNGLFLISPPGDMEAHTKLIPIIDLAKTVGVERIVLSTYLGLDADDEVPLRKVELHLIASGIKYTILRPNFFMENFWGMIDTGRISLAAGDGKVSFISAIDIAEVAAIAFQGDIDGQEFNLTGPEALNHTEVASILSKATGKDIIYQSLTEDEMINGLRSFGMPESYIQYLATLYRLVRDGHYLASLITDDVQRVTQKNPITLTECFSSI